MPLKEGSQVTKKMVSGSENACQPQGAPALALGLICPFCPHKVHWSVIDSENMLLTVLGSQRSGIQHGFQDGAYAPSSHSRGGQGSSTAF